MHFVHIDDASFAVQKIGQNAYLIGVNGITDARPDFRAAHLANKIE